MIESRLNADLDATTWKFEWNLNCFDNCNQIDWVQVLWDALPSTLMLTKAWQEWNFELNFEPMDGYEWQKLRTGTNQPYFEWVFEFWSLGQEGSEDCPECAVFTPLHGSQCALSLPGGYRPQRPESWLTLEWILDDPDLNLILILNYSTCLRFWVSWNALHAEFPWWTKNPWGALLD